jgi:nicotinate-nucleotide--dimethylbenzimidazole phosphoribosyltransferase
MCGAILQAKANGMVMIIDGFIVTSALLAAYQMDKSILDNCIFSHCSGEKGHRTMIDYLGVDYLLDMGLRLGEGTGAAVAYPLIQSAVAFLNEMASFESAGVSTQN